MFYNNSIYLFSTRYCCIANALQVNNYLTGSIIILLSLNNSALPSFTGDTLIVFTPEAETEIMATDCFMNMSGRQVS